MTERVRVDDILELLPELDELVPLLDEVAAGSVSDPARGWSGSGELETLGRRLVRGEGLRERLPELVEAARAHMEGVYAGVAEAVEALSAGDRERAARALLEVGAAEEARERPERAYRYAMAAHAAARPLRERSAATLALRRGARAARALGRPGEAAALYERAWQDALDGGDADGALVAAIGRGNVAVDRGLWQEARGWYHRALDRLGPDGPPRPERWHVLQNLAIVHREEGELNEARHALSAAEAVALSLGDAEAGAIVNNGWGQLLEAEGDLVGAESRFRAALAAARDAGSRTTIAVNLGEVLLARGRVREAREAAREAEAAALRGRVIPRLPEVYRFLGRLALEGSPDHAFVFHERALALIRERRLPVYQQALTLEAYAGARLAVGEIDTGVGLLREALRIHRALEMTRHARRVEDRLAALGAALDEPDTTGPAGEAKDASLLPGELDP
jgi:tetratricopeptide (TPR) repeat protein